MTLKNPPQVRDGRFDEAKLHLFLGAALHAFEFKLRALGACSQQPGRGVLPIEIGILSVICQQPAAESAQAGLAADVLPNPLAAGGLIQPAVGLLRHALPAVC
jgi:hypothetical protein